jgi:hypothetical protein
MAKKQSFPFAGSTKTKPLGNKPQPAAQLKKAKAPVGPFIGKRKK